MQYIEEHAAEFGIQPEQYAIVGYSMGGHLTGLFGTESVGYQHYNVPKPAALLLGYPINDMTYIKPIYHVIQDIGAYGPNTIPGIFRMRSRRTTPPPTTGTV